MSEIDDIFASKDKSKIVQSIASTSSTQKKKKKDKKRKREDDTADDKPLRPTSHIAPEIVNDPSALITSTKRVRNDRSAEGSGAKLTNQDDTDKHKFNDSRGISTRRKTVEGWFIYKEDELGIRDEGGDTPLCPFDCDCCF